MTVDRDPDYLISLVHELIKLPKETGWKGQKIPSVVGLMGSRNLFDACLTGTPAEISIIEG